MKGALGVQYRKMQSRYARLQKKYRQLQENYEAISKDPELMRKEVKQFFQKRISTFVPLPIAIAGMLYYKSIAIPMLGALAFVADVTWEYYTTMWGLWKYRKSRLWMIFGRIPIDVPVAYFFLGAAVATYILFRMNYPGAW